jgi:flagellar biosynthetic protein FliP
MMHLSKILKPTTILALIVISGPVFAQTGMPVINMVDNGNGNTEYSLTLQLLALMTALTLLPSIILMMTSFVRIIIVMSLLRQALGTAQTPPNQVLLGLALFLTIFIMSPVITSVYEDAVQPYSEGSISFEAALDAAEIPVRGSDIETAADVPFTTLVPAFITSELKSAFTIGFLIYIPFIVIDLVVASVLMSMGMMMLSPMMISMPFKLMLFVLVDGWSLIMGSLTSSFVIG